MAWMRSSVQARSPPLEIKPLTDKGIAAYLLSGF